MKVLMLKDKPFVTDARGKPVGVLLDLKTYQGLREAEEDLEDIHAYDAARPKATAALKAEHFATLANYLANRAKAK